MLNYKQTKERNIKAKVTRVTNEDISISKKIVFFRLQKNLSQRQLGNILGVSIQQIQKYEKAANRISAGNLYKMAKELKLDITSFFDSFPYEILDCKSQVLSAKMINLFELLTDDVQKQAIVNLIKSMVNQIKIKEEQ